MTSEPGLNGMQTGVLSTGIVNLQALLKSYRERPSPQSRSQLLQGTLQVQHDVCSWISSGKPVNRKYSTVILTACLLVRSALIVLKGEFPTTN